MKEKVNLRTVCSFLLVLQNLKAYLLFFLLAIVERYAYYKGFYKNSKLTMLTLGSVVHTRKVMRKLYSSRVIFIQIYKID